MAGLLHSDYLLRTDVWHDAFGRLRVAEPKTLFDSKQIFDKAPLLWDESLESGAGISSAHSTATASSVLTSTASTAGKFTRQTFQRINYHPGKSQLILMTGVLNRSGGGAGVSRRIGWFDDSNGMFFSYDAGTANVTLRSKVSGSVVDTVVPQSQWNLDPMNGKGPSGITIDWSKAQQFNIDTQWLGVGRARMGVRIAGLVHYVHEFLAANISAVVFMSNPNLPLRFQMETTASSPVSTMECICASVMSEGGGEDIGILRYASNGATYVTAAVAGTVYALIGIRLKSTHLSASVLIENITVMETTNNDFEWLLMWNPTVAGAGFTFGDQTNSAVQTAVGTTVNTVTSGYAIAGGYVIAGTSGGSSSQDMKNALRLGSTIAGTADRIVLCCRSVTAANAHVSGGITWRELS